jgi:hypothetical protein
MAEAFCMVFLFQKMKIKFKGQLFKDIAEIEVELHWCWTASWNGSFYDAFSSGRSARPSVHSPKETVLHLNYFTATVQ